MKNLLALVTLKQRVLDTKIELDTAESLNTAGQTAETLVKIDLRHRRAQQAHHKALVNYQVALAETDL